VRRVLELHALLEALVLVFEHRVAAADLLLRHRRVVLARTRSLLLGQVRAALRLRGECAALLRLRRLRKLGIVRAWTRRVVGHRQLRTLDLGAKATRTCLLRLVERLGRLRRKRRVVVRVVRARIAHLLERHVVLAVGLRLERGRAGEAIHVRRAKLRVVAARAGRVDTSRREVVVLLLRGVEGSAELARRLAHVGLDGHLLLRVRARADVRRVLELHALLEALVLVLEHGVAAVDLLLRHRWVVLARARRLLLGQVRAALGLRGERAALLRLRRLRKLGIVRAGARRVVGH